MFQPTGYASGVFSQGMPRSPYGAAQRSYADGSLGCTSCSGMGAAADINYGAVLQAMQPYAAAQEAEKRARLIKYGLIGVGVIAVGTIAYLAVKK